MLNLSELRTGLINTDLGLTWDDLAQFPRQLNSPVSVLLLSGFQLAPNQPTVTLVDGRAIFWTDNLELAEEWANQVASHLRDYLIDSCVSGVSRLQLSDISVAYSGLAEEGDLEELETVTLTLTFTLTLTTAS